MHCKDTILRTQNNWPYSKLIPNSGKEFVRLTITYNIIRNSECMIGNNGNLEEMELFYAVLESEKDEDNY